VAGDHVSVGEHRALDRAGRVELGDLLADLEGRRRNMVPREQVHEVDGRRFRTGTIVERERNLALISTDRETPQRVHPPRSPPPGCMEREQLGLGGKHDIATRASWESRNARGRAQGADDLPADRAIADPDLSGEKARCQLA